MWIVVFFAMASAVSYFSVKFWRGVDESIKNSRRRELLTLERKAAARAFDASEAIERIEGNLPPPVWPRRSGSRPKVN